MNDKNRALSYYKGVIARLTFGVWNLNFEKFSKSVIFFENFKISLFHFLFNFI